MIKILAMGYIRTALGRSELELDVEEVKVSRLLQIISSMASQGGLSLEPASTLITVNGVEISALDEDKTVVRSGDKVVLIPITHGG